MWGYAGPGSGRKGRSEEQVIKITLRGRGEIRNPISSS